MSTHSQGRFLGSRSAAFRKTSTSKPDDLRDRSGKDVGAARNYAHEKAAVARALDAKRRREAEVEKRSKKAEQRAKETLRMAKEGLEEAKGKFVYDKPLKGHVAAMEKKDTADLKGMHDRWAGDHKDMKSNPAHSERLLAVHHVLKKRGVSVPDLPQHKNLGMVRRFTAEAAEPSGTEARVKIKNVARPDDEAPTSEKSKLSRQAEIKTKIIEEKSPMRKIDFGLPSNLIDATRSILEKKTQVDLDPETDDKEDNGDNDDDNDDKMKKESKHTTPKTDKEKKLAALAHPKDKITHKDVLVGRGVLKKEETEVNEISKEKKSSYLGAAKKSQDDAIARQETRAKLWGPGMYKFGKDNPKDTKTIAKRAAGMKMATKEETEIDVDSLSEEQLEEVLKKSQPAGEWIKDFVHSKDPKFAGKSKKERMRMALGAYYAKQRNEEVELTAEELERIEAIAAQLDEAKPTVVSAPIRGANQDQSGFGVKKSVADYTISDSKKVKEEAELDEAIKIGSKVKMHAPGKDYHGQVGRVGEIAHGLFKGAAKKYTVDYGDDGKKSITLSKDNVKLHKEEVEQIEELDESTLKDKITDKDGNRYELHLNVKGPSGHKDFHVITQTHKNGKAIRKSHFGMISMKTGKRYVSRDKSYIMKKFNSLKEEVDLTEESPYDSAYKEAKMHVKPIYHKTLRHALDKMKAGHDEADTFSKIHLGSGHEAAKKVLNKHKIQTESVDLEEGRGRPRKNPLPDGKETEGDDTHKHPIQQLNKIAAAIQGNEPHFEHKDGSKTKLTKQVAKHVASIYSGLRTSQDKDDFAKGLHASRSSMMSTIKKHI